MNIVEVTEIEVYAYHGCMEEESRLGGKYLVDVAIETDFSKSAATDHLIDTIDYVVIRRIVMEEMTIRSKLIEHVGYRILKRFQNELGNVIKSRIKVRKLSPPIEGTVKEVAIIIEG
ncbi:dihydroneopterin aldolase [Paracrocinitomix mangrovi]|nr:dihydroneopterin aldolase [Paracrocinitomix mangrovi]UKN03866.1 dihydroneopterin aldolase [Paracrocinitomix mangrovi]